MSIKKNKPFETRRQNTGKINIVKCVEYSLREIIDKASRSTPFLTFSEFGQISRLRASRALARPEARLGGPQALQGRPRAKKATKKGSCVLPCVAVVSLAAC